MANDKQNQLWKSIKEFKSTTKPSKLNDKKKKIRKTKNNKYYNVTS